MTRSPETASCSHRGLVLAAFRRALAREMHVLRRDPGLLWQQLYNRLQWEDEPVPAVLEPEFERRRVPGASPLKVFQTRCLWTSISSCTSWRTAPSSPA